MVARAESWDDVVDLLSVELTDADRADGWNEVLRSRWLASVSGWPLVGSRFLPSTAAQLLRMLEADGITSGPVVKALASAKQGIPGVGTTDAVALAVKEVILGLRAESFKGRAPHLKREFDDGTVQLVHLQRINAGVTGREPGFTVNLNVVHGALRRAWAAVDHWQARHPVRGGMATGIAERLGSIAFGHDHWWHPSTAEEGHDAAQEVLTLLESHGLPWLDELTDPDRAVATLLSRPSGLTELEVAAALLVERPEDSRRAEALTALRQWEQRIGGDDRRQLDWLVENLQTSNPV